MNVTSPAPPRGRALALGITAGAFSGLFGVGGGSIIVPGALTFPGVRERAATAASLLAITVMALVGALVQSGYGNLRPLDAIVVGLPATAGVLLGTAWQQRLAPERVRTLFAGLLVIVAVLTIIGLRPAPGRESALGLIGAGAVGVGAGVMAGLLGVGGGVLFIPALVFFVGLTQLQAEATSLLAIVPVSLAGAANQYRYGNLDLHLAGPVALGAAPGALVGVAVVNLLPVRLVQILFGLLLLWIAAWVLRRRSATSGEDGDPAALLEPFK